MKKIILYCIGALLCFTLVLIAGGWLIYQSLYNAYKTDNVVAHHMSGDSLNTNSIAVFTEQEIAMYGKWEGKEEQQNYTLFTLDDAGDGFYWGKEWNEADGVLESDLEEKGNGWFRWKTKGEQLLIIYNTNIGFSVPMEYAILHLEESELDVQRRFSRTPAAYTRSYN